MVEIARVGGDLVIVQAKQALVGNVGGDLEAESVKGKFESRVGGDVELSLTDPSLAPIRIIAGGDIQLAVPENANALLALTAGGEISIKTTNHQAEYGNVARDILLGQGGERVELKAGGDIFITDKGGIPSGSTKCSMALTATGRNFRTISMKNRRRVEEGYSFFQGSCEAGGAYLRHFQDNRRSLPGIRQSQESSGTWPWVCGDHL